MEWTHLSYHIRDRVNKTAYNRMSKGGTSGMLELTTAILTRRDSTPTRPWVSYPSLGKGYGLVMSLNSRGTEKGPTDLH
jgi:hypothetical protein